MEQKFEISVVICTYNGTKYVDAQIDSVMNQQYSASQVIISDDCSTDMTWEKLLAWKNKYPDIIEIYKHSQNIGYNKNFEFALSKVKGCYVALCDQDDIWHVDKLKVLVDAMNANPSVNVFHHDEEIIGRAVTHESSQTYWNPYQGKGVGIIFVLNRLTGHKLFFDTKLLKHILPIPNGVIYDWWINAIVAVHGETLYIDKKLMDYRLHDESAYFSDVAAQLKDVTIPIQTALHHFSRIQGMSDEDNFFITRFIQYYKKHISNKFDFRLFLFLVKNRNVFFKDYHTPFGGIKRTLFIIRVCRAFSKW